MDWRDRRRGENTVSLCASTAGVAFVHRRYLLELGLGKSKELNELGGEDVWDTQEMRSGAGKAVAGVSLQSCDDTEGLGLEEQKSIFKDLNLRLFT